MEQACPNWKLELRQWAKQKLKKFEICVVWDSNSKRWPGVVPSGILRSNTGRTTMMDGKYIRSVTELKAYLVPTTARHGVLAAGSFPRTKRQVGGVMMLASEENRGKLAFFMAIDNAKFRKTVVPGDQLVFEVQAGKMRSKIGSVHGRALVDGKGVAEADFMFALSKD